jgi:hypothetical protein
MNQVSISEELKGVCQLFEEVADDDFVKCTATGVRVLGNHVLCILMLSKSIPSLDEEGQIS